MPFFELGGKSRVRKINREWNMVQLKRPFKEGERVYYCLGKPCALGWFFSVPV